MTWLLRDGEVLAAAEGVDVLGTRRAPALVARQQLAGHAQFEGALVLGRAWVVHTFGMQFPLDVAYCATGPEPGWSLVVVRVCRMPPWRLGRPSRSQWVIEARAGAFDRWSLRAGDRIELRG